MTTATLTPGHLARRGEFYFQLAQYSAAGVGIVDALHMMQRQPPARSYAAPLARVLGGLGHGMNLVESLRQADWLPEFDLALIGAGEQSGRTDVCFKLLANYYQNRAQMARQFISDLAYPLVLFHMAVFLLPFPNLFLTMNLLAYLRQTLGVLLPAYALVAVVLLAGQGRRGERWRSLVESVLHHVPVLGKARESLSLSRLCMALEGLLSAGVTILEAWEIAARASASPRLRRVVEAWRPAVHAGQTPAEAVAASGAFPHLFTTQYATGEISGRLDEVLGRLHEYYQQESTRKFHELCTWLPRLFYFAVVLVIAYRVVSFWSGYFQQVNDVLNF